MRAGIDTKSKFKDMYVSSGKDEYHHESAGHAAHLRSEWTIEAPRLGEDSGCFANKICNTLS